MTNPFRLIFSTGKSNRKSRRNEKAHRPPRAKLGVEALEERVTPIARIVTSTLDSGAGSLREAVTAVNASADAANTITFMAGLGPVVLTTGALPTLTKTVDITGNGALATTIRQTGAGRIFTFDDGAAAAAINVSITGLTLEGGNSGANGGAVLNVEALTVDRVQFQNNTTGAGAFDGGAIHTSNAVGTTTIRQSAFVNNSSGRDGGALFINNAGGATNVINSTLTQNSAFSAANGGGGIFVNAGTAMVQNATIAFNNANAAAASKGGGLNTLSATVTVENTIISNNVAGTAANNDVNGAFAAASRNNVVTVNPGTSLGTAPIIGDPLLGGQTRDATSPTTTLSPAGTSIAVNAGAANGLTVDQRGATRPFGAAIDVGAVEVGATPPGGAAPPASTTTTTTPSTTTTTTPSTTGTSTTSSSTSSTSGLTSQQAAAQNQAIILAFVIASSDPKSPIQLLSLADLTSDGFVDPIVGLKGKINNRTTLVVIVGINGVTAVPLFFIPVGSDNSNNA